MSRLSTTRSRTEIVHKRRQELSFAGDSFGHAIQFFVKPRVTTCQPSLFLSFLHLPFLARGPEKKFTYAFTQSSTPTGETHVRVFFRVTANCYGRYDDRLPIYITVQGVSETLRFPQSIKIKLPNILSSYNEILNDLKELNIKPWRINPNFEIQMNNKQLQFTLNLIYSGKILI